MLPSSMEVELRNRTWDAVPEPEPRDHPAGVFTHPLAYARVYGVTRDPTNT